MKWYSTTKSYLLLLGPIDCHSRWLEHEEYKNIIYNCSYVYTFLLTLDLISTIVLSYNYCVTDSKEGSEDGDLEHELQDWEKEVINPNNHAELKVPMNGVSINKIPLKR